MNPRATAQIVKRHARAIGFDLVGVSDAAPLARAAYYRSWIVAGHAGEMRYLGAHRDIREQPAQLLAGAASIICVALNYRPANENPAPDEGATPDNASNPTGRVARYARGEDYHVVMRRMLEQLAQALREAIDQPFETRACVDTAPINEREVAARAGLGWIGKNTLVLHPRLGSYFFLGELVTTLALEPDEPEIDHCGTCTRCLDACPTNAFPAPYQMNAARCISYLTIEHRSAVAPELAAKSGDWVYGCDICQEVCPFNRDAPPATSPALTKSMLPAKLDLLDLLALRSAAYRRLAAGTAARRARRSMWRRNAAVALGNHAPRDEAEADVITKRLETACDDEDATVAQAAEESLLRLTNST